MLKYFIGYKQRKAIERALQGEEWEHFHNLIEELKVTIQNMPKPYETDKQGMEAMASLHYFKNGSDWWIVERDYDDEQFQAFGLACLNGDYQNAEMGYISIQDLIENDVELDLYYKPETIKEIKEKLYKK